MAASAASKTTRRVGSGSTGRLPGAEQIYVMPYAWRDAPWWSGRQVENLRAILDLVKRTYNVDENRVVLSGVSDGGTGAYYIAMRDTTPFASFLPLNGFIMVLRNETAEADGDLFPNNLREQAAVHRQRRPRSDVSDERRRSVCRALEEGRRRSRLSAATERGARHVVVAGGQGFVRDVRRRSSAPSAARYAELGKRTAERAEPGALAGHRSPRRRAAGRPGAARREQDVHAVRRRTSGSEAAARASIASSRDPTPSRSASGAAMSSSRSTINRHLRAPMSRSSFAAIRRGGRCCSPSRAAANRSG